MRVISQKGIENIIDMPYEQTVLSNRSGSIFVHNSAKFDGALIAKYSTKHGARKALEMLWHECECNSSFFRFPEDSEV